MGKTVSQGLKARETARATVNNVPKEERRHAMKIPALEPYMEPNPDVGIVELTAEEALSICEHMSFERSRSIDNKHIANLTDYLEHNDWIGLSMLVFGTDGRKLKLVDGQHRLIAHTEHARRLKRNISRGYVIQVVPGDAAFAYSRLDSRQKKRPSHVVARALDLDVPEVLAPYALDAAGSAIRYRTERPKRVEIGETLTLLDQPYRDTIKYIKEHKEPFHALGPAFENLTPYDSRVRNALLRRSVLAICLETVAATTDKGVRFWRAVLSGENADKAARYVRDRMLQRVPYQGQKASRERALTAAIGWNAHLTGTISKPRGKPLAVKKTDLIIR